jgi:hypothetical protein
MQRASSRRFLKKNKGLQLKRKLGGTGNLDRVRVPMSREKRSNDSTAGGRKAAGGCSLAKANRDL